VVPWKVGVVQGLCVMCVCARVLVCVLACVRACVRAWACVHLCLCDIFATGTHPPNRKPLRTGAKDLRLPGTPENLDRQTAEVQTEGARQEPGRELRL
jgi:hypothetical protein